METFAIPWLGCKGICKEQASEWRSLAVNALDDGRALGGAAFHELAVCANDKSRLRDSPGRATEREKPREMLRRRNARR
ncbi:hypothetical protein [Paraburkholderia acidiphila]|uniref:Uncharacterized protein n=1 Tax=Paraburkholderia acidiphila TaxID=2571747 RepID=A0A7Z2G5C5_9BURK|nr:hypothetical protein [Paraburkholderia acidiphila]QGZ55531.1 hypothetical protein FAZ97_11745 [Paraburkholderia acidiphila]